MTLSGFMCVNRAVRLGYPFVEGVLSVLPVVDEFVLAVGQDRDGTLEVAQRLAKVRPKVRIINQTWPTRSELGHCIGELQTEAIKHCKGDYILLVQADEVWHEEALEVFDMMPLADENAFLRADVLHNFQSIGTKAWATRYVRRTSATHSPGDGMHVYAGPSEKARPVPVEVPAAIPAAFVNVGWSFPVSRWRKVVNHAPLWGGVDDDSNPEVRWAREKLADYERLGPSVLEERLLRRQTVHDIPRILMGLVGEPEYKLRPELLEPGYHV